MLVLFLRRNDSVLKSFGRSNPYDGLRQDLNRFTGCWVPSRPGFSLVQHGFSDAWKSKGPFFLGLGDCEARTN